MMVFVNYVLNNEASLFAGLKSTEQCPTSSTVKEVVCVGGVSLSIFFMINIIAYTSNYLFLIIIIKNLQKSFLIEKHFQLFGHYSFFGYFHTFSVYVSFYFVLF